jgi:lipopolysaccharide export system permease protein
MKLLDRLIIRELIGPVLNSMFMFVAVVFAGAYLFGITDLLLQGVPLGVVLRIAIYTLPALITPSFPMGMLLGTLLAFGRLPGDSEHIAMFACGVSLYRIAVPVALVGFAVSTVAFIWNETVVPPSQRAYIDLKQNAREIVGSHHHAIDYVIHRPNGSVDEWVSIQGGYDKEARCFRNVTMVKMSDEPGHLGEPAVVVYAEKAIPRGNDPKGLDWRYQSVYITYLHPNAQNRTIVENYSEIASAVSLPANVRMGHDFKGIVEQNVLDNNTMSFRSLRDKINGEIARGNDTLGAQVDLWGKLSVPLASVIFGIVGIPLGVRPHRGSRAMGFGLAIGIIFTYYILNKWMYILGSHGTIQPFLASFAGCVVGLIVAFWLISRARQ